MDGNLSYCPLCFKPLGGRNVSFSPGLCQCSWHRSQYASDSGGPSSALIVFLFLGIATLTAIVHGLTWQEFATEVPRLQALRLSNQLSDSGYARYASICEHLKRYKCAIAVSAERVRFKASEESLIDRALLLDRLGFADDAVSAFETYIALGFDRPKALLHYASLLERRQQYDLALNFYTRAMTGADESKKAAVQGIVRIHLRNQNFAEALAVIQTFRQAQPNENVFQSEFEYLLKKVDAKPANSQLAPKT